MMVYVSDSPPKLGLVKAGTSTVAVVLVGRLKPLSLTPLTLKT